MNLRLPEVILGALLTLSILGIGMTLSSSQAPQQPQQTSAVQHTSEPKTEAHSNGQSLWVPADSVGLYTLILAVFTGLLVGVSGFQGYFLLRADKTARIAANAADLSARAAIGMQLPIIRGYAQEFTITDNAESQGGTIVGDPTIYKSAYVRLWKMYFGNIGKSTAYPFEYGFGWSVKELSKEPVYDKINPCNPDQVITEGGQFAPPVDDLVFQLSSEIRKNIRDGQAIFRIFSYLKYRDFLDNSHEARFCWRLDPAKPNGTRGGLLPDHTAPASYTRKI